jgi:DNA-binding SARP family transcriptional activator
MTREDLAERLWEGTAAARATANLRMLLSRIKTWEAANGRAVLKVTPFTVGRDETTIESDLSQLLAIERVDSPAGLRLLAELYGGDFLLGFDEGEPGITQWIAEQRPWLQKRFVDLALAGAERVGGPVAQDVLRHVANEAPYDDAVARARMVAARDDRAEVRRIYERFAERLRAELGNKPDAKTDALLRELGSEAPAAASMRVDEERIPGVHASLDSVPRVLILPPTADVMPVADRRLGEALIEEVTHTLGRLRTFAVFAPHTARAIGASAFPSGNPYGADYLVTTSLMALGSVQRLRVDLTRVATTEVMLTESLNFAPEDLQAHHFHLAAAIGMRLSRGIEKMERRISGSTGSASAYVHYLKGCDQLRSTDLRAVRKAKGHFRQALKLSRDFVAPRALLARAMSVEWLLLDRNDRERIEQAISLAREAADLDPLDPNGHREVGHALIYSGEIDEAVESLRSAAQLGPHSADVLFQYGDGLIHQGNIKPAREVLGKALELNPLAPDLYFWATASADYFLEDYAGAAAMAKRIRNREPAARFLAAVEAMNGNLAEARQLRDVYLSAHPDFRLADYIFPFRPAQLEHYFDGLRRAGFV